MNTATDHQPPLADTGEDATHLLVVCLDFPIGTKEPVGLMLERFGAELLGRYLVGSLQSAGLDHPTQHPFALATSLHRSACFFPVRHVGAALRVLASALEATSLAGFSAIALQDLREGYYRALWPAKPLFDVQAFMTAWFADKEQRDAESARARQLILDTFEQLLPPENPS